MHSVWVLIEMNALDNTSKSRPGSGGAKKSPPLNPFVSSKGHVPKMCVPSLPSRRAAAARKTSKGNLGRLPLALLELLLWKLSARSVSWVSEEEEEWADRGAAYQSLGGAVERMPVVSPELGVGAVQRGVALGLGLLDAVAVSLLASVGAARGLVVASWEVRYPFRCALRDWLCWDEFLDSGGKKVSTERESDGGKY